MLVGGLASPARAQGPSGDVKGQPLEALMSSTGFAALRHIRALRGEIEIQLVPTDEFLPDLFTEEQETFGSGPGGDGGRNRRFRNVFVNDPCLDPAPTETFPLNFFNTVQSETDIAILNKVDDHDDHFKHGDDDHHGSGRLMVAGYNDSRGFEDNRQGISGFSYSTNGGDRWIDGGGLPPKFPTGVPSGTLGSDAYFGDPVVVVHHKTKTFYYSSLYQNAAGEPTLSVNRGRFKFAGRQVPVESKANTRCKGNPAAHGIPDPPSFFRKRIIWDPPVEAVKPVLNGPGFADDDFLDKEWLYLDQNTGVLYLTYTRFEPDGETPIELVRSFDGGQTWTPPSVIVPNLFDTFNQATQAAVTPTGRVIVTWFARTFPPPDFVEHEHRIEIGYSDNCSTPADPCDFSDPVVVAVVNPQGEPPGYNRARPNILNAPFITVDKGRDDGKFTRSETRKPGFGNLYVTYFDGLTPFGPEPDPDRLHARAAKIHLSRSTTNGTTWGPEVKVNDDNTETSHVFPSVQVNEHGRVFVTWIDRRVDPARNLASDTYGDISKNRGHSFGKDVRLSDVSTDWITREDAQPDFGDYNHSAVIDFKTFVSIWADGRFPQPAPLTPTPTGGFTRPADQAATPDAIFEIFKENDDD